MTPDINKEKPVTRIYGSEIEYGMRFDGDYAEYKDAIVDLGDIRERSGLLFAGHGFLENGGRLYVDQKKNVEYATPECLRLNELTAAEFAGEIIVAKVFSEPESRFVPHKRVGEIQSRDSCGAHENYGTSLSIAEFKRPPVTDILAAHLATRTIFTGAGQYQYEQFNIAQKPFSLEEVIGEQTTSSKPLINTRDTSYSNSWMNRLHLISGDANISPWAIMMKFGTTSLVLRLFEHEHELDVGAITLDNPLAAGKFVARKPENMHAPLKLRNGSFASAIEIQSRLAQEAEHLQETIHLPKDEQQVINDWLEVCESLKDGIDSTHHLQRQIDWVRKKQIIDRAQIRDKSEQQLTALDLYFDQVGTDTASLLGKKSTAQKETRAGLGITLRRKALTALECEQIDAALITPPPTRAYSRGMFIKQINEHFPDSEFVVQWDFIQVNGRQIWLDPPHSKKAIDIESVIQKLKESSLVSQHAI